MSAFTHIARRFIVPVAGAGARSDRLRLVFDIEANGLLGVATTVWCIIIIDLDSGQLYEYGPGQISAALAHLARADVLIGHNIIGYDLPALEQLHDWRPKAGCAIVDTLVAGRLILPHIADLDDQAAAMGDPKLGKLRGSYKLEAWGMRLDIHKIGADVDFSVWSRELQERCVGDVRLTKAVLHFLQPDGYSETALALEHWVVAICDQIKSDGVPFDTIEAEQRYRRWLARRTELETELRQQFPNVKNWNSRQQIITLLQSRGWTPRKFTDKGNPSLDEDVLATVARIYPEFVGLSEYFALGVLIGKIVTGPKSCRNNVAPDGRIHNAPIHIRTPHSRAQYSNPNLGGIPNPKKGKPFGSECRTLFRHPGDWVFVTCDQANLQDRAFAHHLTEFDGGAYAQDFLAGVDKHWHNAAALELIPDGTARDKESKLHTAIREGAKHFRYGFLFGAAAPRCGEILTETVRTIQHIDPTYIAPTDGERARDRFIAATPGLAQLRNKLAVQVAQHGWLPGLDGRRVPCRAQYTALNYALASIEAIVCKRWLTNVHRELCARFHYGWDGDVLLVLWVHDELVCCCRPEIAEQVGEILVRYAKEAGTHYQLKVPLDAEYKIGRSWAGEPVSTEPVTRETAPESTPATITSDEGLQVVSAGAEPMAPQLASVMPEKISTAPEMTSAVTNLAPVGSTSEMTSTDAESMPPEPAGILDADGDPLGAGSGVAAELESAGAVGGAPVKSVPQPLTIAPVVAPEAKKAQPSRLNGAGAAAGERAMPSERAGGNGATRGNGYDGGGSKIFCPFHDDHTTPNLHIYTDENDPHYHCFTCLAHGPLSELDDLGVDWRATVSTTHPQVDAAATLAYAHQLWGQARPIVGTLAERYLVHVRGIDVSALPPNIEEVLRFHPSCPFNGKGRLPCLVALFRDVETDVPAGIHRIALTPEVFAGAKVERQMLGRWAKPRAIKLWPVTDRLYWGEGIETVAAAATHVEHRGALMRPAWAAGAGGGLGKLPVIPGVERLIILVDNDLNGAGQAAATRCATRWSQVGRTVIKLTPKRPGADFNDIAKEKAP